MFDTWDQALHMRDKLHEVSHLADSLGALAGNIVDDFDNHKRCATAEAQLRETTLEGLKDVAIYIGRAKPMNKTQRLKEELLDELTKHVSLYDANYFANWLLTHYKISEYKDVQPLNVGQSDTNFGDKTK